MDQQGGNEVEMRLERLERQNRKLRLILILTMMAVTAAATMGQTQLKEIPKVLEAESFVLRGPDGSEQGKMGTSPEGHPYLVLLERSGRPRVALGRLYGHASRKIEGQVITYGSGPSEGYYNKDGKRRSAVPYSQWMKERTTDVREPGEPAESLMVVFDGSGNVAWSVP